MLFWGVFTHIYFPASGQAVVTSVGPSPARFLPSTFIAHNIGFSNPTLLVDLSPGVANSRSRAFRKSICAQEKIPTDLYEHALGGTGRRLPLELHIMCEQQEQEQEQEQEQQEQQRQHRR